MAPSDSTPAAVAPPAAWVAWVFLGITCVCWAANAVFAKLAVGEVSPMALVLLRWLFVILVLAVVARGPLRRDSALLRPHLFRIGLLGALGYTVFNVMFYIAAHHTSAVNLGVIQAVMPVFIFVIAFARFRTPVRSAQLIGVVFAVVGVVVVAAHGSWARLIATQFATGDLLILAATVLYAIYTVALRNRPAVDPLAFFAVLSAGALLTAIPFALYEWWAGDWLAPTPAGWAIILAIALFPSLLGQILYIRGVALIGPNRAGLFVNLTPVLAAGLAVLFLNEPFHAYHGVGLALVFLGIALSERG